MLKVVCFNKKNSGGMNNLNSIRDVIKDHALTNVKTFDRDSYLSSFKIKTNDVYVIWMVNHYSLLLLIYLALVRLFMNIKIITVQHNKIFHPQTSSSLHNIVSTFMEQIGFFVSNHVCFLSKIIYEESGRKNKILLSDVMPFDIHSDSSRKNDKKNYDLLYFGRNISYKGLDILHDSLIQTKRSLRVVIAGLGVSSLNWDKLRDKHEIEIHDKYLSDEELKILITSSEFSVYPYRSVSQCGPLVITLGYNGRAIVPNLEYFTPYSDLHNMVFFDTGSVESLASKLNNLEELKTNCDLAHEDNKLHAFSWIHLVNKLLSI